MQLLSLNVVIKGNFKSQNFGYCVIFIANSFTPILISVDDGKLQDRPQYRGLGHAFRSIFKTEGARGLYKGVSPNVFGAGAAWGSYFLLYV